MKAVVCPRYGPPEILRLEEVPIPAPAAGEVLVRVQAAGVAAGDWHLMRGDPFLVRLMFGLRRPRHPVLGSDVAGVVAEVGEGVTGLGPGDPVFGHLSEFGFGAFAEYAAAPEEAWVTRPGGVDVEAAAAAPGSALAALQGLRHHGGLAAGMDVLVNGASGGVGSAAVQIARAAGARVTGVCGPANVDYVRGLGAHEVLDYTRVDYTDDGARFDLVLDVAAYRHPREALAAVRPGGAYVLVGGEFRRTLQVMVGGRRLARRTGRRVAFFVTKPNRDDLLEVRRLLEAGALRPHIEARYPLEETAAAVAHVESRHPRGKVVVSVSQPD